MFSRFFSTSSFGWPEQPGRFQLLAKALLGLHRQGLIAGFQARVLAQPNHGGGTAIGSDLIVQQALHAIEDGAGDVFIRQQIALRRFRRSNVPIRLRDQNFEILAHQRILLRR